MEEGGRRGSGIEGDVTRRSRLREGKTPPTIAGLANGTRGHQPQNGGGLWELEKVRKQFPF